MQNIKYLEDFFEDKMQIFKFNNHAYKFERNKDYIPFISIFKKDFENPEIVEKLIEVLKF